MMTGNGYTTITTNGGTTGVQNTAGVIALSGGWIYNALNLSNLDELEQEKANLDTCLSHPSP